MAENPYAWDYDYKKHYFEAFEKFEKEGDGNDSIGRFLAYKSTGDAFSTEPECIGSSKDVLSDASPFPIQMAMRGRRREGRTSWKREA